MLGNGIKPDTDKSDRQDSQQRVAKAMLSSKQGQRQVLNQAGCQKIVAIICLSLSLFGCESNKLTQCEEIFPIARDVYQSNQNLNNIGNEQQSGSMKSWLQAANKFNQAADKMRALKVDRRELIQYQNQFVRIYRIYAQTTYDAVRARENKDLSVLESARNDAIQAGIIQRQLIQEINAYCSEAD